jgi:hypothetical protein
MASSVVIVPYMLGAGDEKVIGDRLHAALTKPPKFENPAPLPEGTPLTVAGQWDAHLEFGRGSAHHTLMLEQDAGKLTGTHHTEFYASDLNGMVAVNKIRFQTSFQIQGQRVNYLFNGTVDGDKITGTVAMGEYGETTWTAERHKYRTTGGRRNG